MYTGVLGQEAGPALLIAVQTFVRLKCTRYFSKLRWELLLVHLQRRQKILKVEQVKGMNWCS